MGGIVDDEGSYLVPPAKLTAALVAVGLVAAACGDVSDTRAGSSPAVSDDPAGGSPGDEAAGGSTSEPSSSEPSGPFDVLHIESTPREDVPSALDDPSDASFPEPLIDLDEIRSGGPPPDGIPPIDAPRFEHAGTVDWLGETEPVLALEIDGEARAYPLQVMTWHELVNDAIGDTPVTISYCPLCNSALAYDRRLGDRVLDFGTSGSLYNSSLVMYDRQTESLWTHFDARAVVGYLTGETLVTYPVSTVSWADFRGAYPDGLVLSRDTGFSRSYGINPYVGYDDINTSPFLYDGPVDGRLPAKARVLVVRGDGPAVAIVQETLFDDRVIEFEAHGRDLVALLMPGTVSGLETDTTFNGRDVGATGIFVPLIEGATVDLEPTVTGFLDSISGSTFNIFGLALDGPLAGAQLEAVEHLDTFWFAIGAFDPDTVVVGIEG